MTGDRLPAAQRAALVALVSLPSLGPARLRALLDRFGEPTVAWDAVRRGRLDHVPLRRRTGRHELVEQWRRTAGTIDPVDLLARHRAAGIEILAPEDPAWPTVLVGDPEPPELLFVRGDPSLLEDVSVAVVGTRRCTAAGASIARSMGAGLADAGVPVVSGLAFGIDAAAHRGALEGGGRPVGVVGTGIDVVYPRGHTDLWTAVGDAGVLVSEYALGVGAERWRFPARNRLIAAFAAAVVVVESPAEGGSISTVESAHRRNTDVLAVPGSVLSPQSAGTNQLLFDGASMVRDAADVLGELGTAVPVPPGGQARLVWEAPDAVAGDPYLRRVLDALSPTGTGVEAIAGAIGGSVVEVTTALARLEAAGVARRIGAGYCRVAS